jgi:hypothetical protein
MSKRSQPADVDFLEGAIVREFKSLPGYEGNWCVFRDGRYRDDPEIYCFFLGLRGLWHCRAGGLLFRNEAEARIALSHSRPQAWPTKR